MISLPELSDKEKRKKRIQTLKQEKKSKQRNKNIVVVYP